MTFKVESSVHLPKIRNGDSELIGSEFYNIIKKPSETMNISKQNPKIVKKLKSSLAKVSWPTMSNIFILMIPVQQCIYDQSENTKAPE